MRTIDSDALIKQMIADAEQIEDSVARIFYSAAISDIEHAPTIEPERKRGKWIWHWDQNDPDTAFEASCSICNKISTMPVGDFCKWCGSKMESEKNETN